MTGEKGSKSSQKACVSKLSVKYLFSSTHSSIEAYRPVKSVGISARPLSSFTKARNPENGKQIGHSVRALSKLTDLK